MPNGVKKVFVPYDRRLISHAPTNAASVVPIAMEVDCKSQLAVIAPEEIVWEEKNDARAKKDDTRIAGQTR
jgi:hypothetical protein